VLEIGCGTGLLLSRVAPHCESYVGTDFSAEAIALVETLRDERGLSGVRLLRREAEDFSELEPGSFDLVLLNSVVQYFPGIETLMRVLDGAARVLAPGGRILLGDLRHLGLLEAMHASVALAQASPGVSEAELRRRLRREVAQEAELLLHPAMFAGLRAALPRLGHVSVRPKRGRARNELTRFRYEAVLQLDVAPPAPASRSLDWRSAGLDAARPP
jgi:SAM-dependent methyltransferase